MFCKFVKQINPNMFKKDYYALYFIFHISDFTLNLDFKLQIVYVKAGKCQGNIFI